MGATNGYPSPNLENQRNNERSARKNSADSENAITGETDLNKVGFLFGERGW